MTGIVKEDISESGSEEIFTLLYETGKLINSSLEINDIISNILKIVRERLKYTEFSFVEIKNNKLFLKSALNHPLVEDEKYYIPVGRGITGTVAATGEPILTNDVSKDSRYIGIRPNIKSELCVPIKINGKVVAIFNVESRKLNAFTDRDLILMSALADQTALAMKNAQLYKSYADSAERLAKLYECGKTINSSLELKQIFKALINLTNKEIPYAFVSIILIKGGNVYIAEATGFPKGEYEKYSAAIGEGVVGKVAETGKPFLINDVSKCPFYIEFKKGHTMRSELAVPIKYGDSVIGVFNVESERVNAFDDDDLLFVSALAEQAAIAIKNSQLYSEIENFNRVLKKRVESATTDLRKANAELEQLNRIKTDFVSIVSHELRTPLTGIIGYISLVRDEVGGTVNKQQKEFLDIAGGESRRLYRLISELLDIQKIESRKMPYLFKELNLGKFLKSYVKEVENDCASKGLALTLSLPRHVPAIKADEDKVKQIMTNLVSNAIKFTHKGSVSIGVNALPDFVEISVSDTGTGISEADQNKLFEKFSQVNMKASREVGGTGLGLAITKSLVEAHKGNIRVSSESGRGSTFTFTLSRNLG